jgi:hypothetical protein
MTTAPWTNPLMGNAPLTSAVQQGFGIGLQPFNPQWYDQLSKNLFQQGSQNLTENVLPALNSNAIMAGGYGGDRANLAQGVATDRMNQSVFNAVAPLYASGYENTLNRNLQTGQNAMQGLLGLGSLDIGSYNAQTNAATAASGAAGNPIYTNPFAAGLGGALGMYQLWKLLGGG